MIRHLLCCQGLAVAYYGFTLDVANLAHPRLSLKQGLGRLIITKILDFCTDCTAALYELQVFRWNACLNCDKYARYKIVMDFCR